VAIEREGQGEQHHTTVTALVTGCNGPKGHRTDVGQTVTLRLIDRCGCRQVEALLSSAQITLLIAVSATLLSVVEFQL
jgi:hypothetical protein